MTAERVNVLSLDGGGVRGLSTLLILEELLKHVERFLPGEEVTPQKMFGLVAGTSTGGLIALMLGKFGMSVSECISQYHRLSTEIFGHYSKRGKLTRGHWKERYSGQRLRDCVRDVAKRQRYAASVRMRNTEGNDPIPTTVVAREFDSKKRLKRRAAFLCTHACDREFDCRVCDAARATSAAPYYFPEAHFGEPERIFMDGGFRYNNPSYVVYLHVSESTAQQTLNTNIFRFVNLGTGTDPETLENESSSASESERDPLPTRMKYRARRGLTGFVNLIREMKADIVDTENAFSLLEVVAHTNPDLEVFRFSSCNDVFKIKLDAYKELTRIESLTREYLSGTEIQRNLTIVAEALAKDYKARKAATRHNGPLTSPAEVQMNTQDQTLVPQPVEVQFETQAEDDIDLSEVSEPRPPLQLDALTAHAPSIGAEQQDQVSPQSLTLPSMTMNGATPTSSEATRSLRDDNCLSKPPLRTVTESSKDSVRDAGQWSEDSMKVRDYPTMVP